MAGAPRARRRARPIVGGSGGAAAAAHFFAIFLPFFCVFARNSGKIPRRQLATTLSIPTRTNTAQYGTGLSA
ncbi:MAG: hypothetical protein MPK09_02495 [Gammaproteobacteria bacterium]|nr:hypothetical protein [Gammaproteobacteria bacterium]